MIYLYMCMSGVCVFVIYQIVFVQKLSDNNMLKKICTSI